MIEASVAFEWLLRRDSRLLDGFCVCARRVFGGFLFALPGLRCRRPGFGLSFGCDLRRLVKKARRTLRSDAALSDALCIQCNHLEQFAVAGKILLILLASVDE